MTVPAPGRSMRLAVPLSAFGRRPPRQVRMYGTDTQSGARIPSDGSMLNLTLPAFVAHVAFYTPADPSSESPLSGPTGLVDTGKAYAEHKEQGFAYGWSSELEPAESLSPVRAFFLFVCLFLLYLCMRS